MRPSAISLSRIIAAVGLGTLLGLSGETLLLLRGQSAHLESSLRDDFRVTVFLSPGFSEDVRKSLGDTLRDYPEVTEVEFISSDRALATLRVEDPALVASVSWLGESPLPASFELRLDPEGLVRLPDWAEMISGLSGVTEASYPAGRLEAILHAQLYGRYLNLVLGIMGCAGVIVCLSGLGFPAGRGSRVGGWMAILLGAAAGVMAGIGLSCLILYPLRHAHDLWVWPAASEQGILLAGAVLSAWAVIKE